MKNDEDQEWQEYQAAVIRAWEEVGLVEPGWTVKYDGWEGAYRAVFTLAPGAFPGSVRRQYNMSENEFCTYVMALADLAPGMAGVAGMALAEEFRQEALPETDYRPGDGPVPLDSYVEYLGNKRPRGLYVVQAHYSPNEVPERAQEEIQREDAYPDGVAYLLWPVGVPVGMDNHGCAVWWARRTSFRLPVAPLTGEGEPE